MTKPNFSKIIPNIVCKIKSLNIIASIIKYKLWIKKLQSNFTPLTWKQRLMLKLTVLKSLIKGFINKKYKNTLCIRYIKSLNIIASIIKYKLLIKKLQSNFTPLTWKRKSMLKLTILKSLIKGFIYEKYNNTFCSV